MLTTQNYFQRIKEIDPATLPPKLKEGYEFVKEVTENHKTWDYYKSDTDIKATIDEYLANLSDRLDKKNGKAEPVSEGSKEKAAREAAKKLIRVYVLRGDSAESLKKSHLGTATTEFSADIRGAKIIISKLQGRSVNFSFPFQSIYNEIKEEGTPSKTTASSSSSGAARSKKKNKSSSSKDKPVRIKSRDARPVEQVDDEIRFIKRYALLHGKTKTDAQILNFINSLQKAILERRIRKSSPYAQEISYIQDNLVRLYNKMDKEVTIKVRDNVLEEFLAIAGTVKVRSSVKYLKRYIRIQGKHINKEKAQKLIDLIQKAVKTGTIPKSDPYADRLDRVSQSLQTFTKLAKKGDTLAIHKSVLNGIQDALDGCSCCSGGNCKEGELLEGLGEPSATAVGPDSSGNNIMSSVDFAEMNFDTLGFKGKWRELIGDPCESFTAMVYGRPKMGKSYLCIDMAGYLARDHGDTLYVAKEEKLDATLQQKLNDTNVKHPCLFVSDHLPDDLSPYQFIFLDSVNKLQLTPEDLEQLKTANPGKSFIYIFQSTKDGHFRGANQFQHDVDVVIEVPEKGKAVQYGRFNQGGEMEIFSEK